jgi:2Fe-2S ferredoxin
VAVVRVEPSGITFEAAPGQTIMAAAIAAGYRWPTICGGQGTCRTCFVRVRDGADRLTPVERWEREGIDELGAAAGGGDRGEVRLACQARPTGDVAVHKPGVRPDPRHQEAAG